MLEREIQPVELSLSGGDANSSSGVSQFGLEADAVMRLPPDVVDGPKFNHFF